jgi:transposase InsO family protein
MIMPGSASPKLYVDERQDSAVRFLERRIAYFLSLGVSVKRVLTDNGSAFRSKAFAAACMPLGLDLRNRCPAPRGTTSQTGTSYSNRTPGETGIL